MENVRTTTNPSVLDDDDKRSRQQPRHKRPQRNVDHWPILQLLDPSFCEKIRTFMVIGERGEGVLMVDKENVTYWFGEMKFGWEEFEESRQTSEPTRLKLESPVISMAHGDDHILLLTERGQCYGMGKNNRGQLAQDKLDEQTYFEPVLIQSQFKLVQIRCGLDHCLALTDDGRVIAWGANDWGQVGLDLKQVQSQPSLHQVSLKSHHAVGIASGAGHSFFWTNQGLVYGWGSNDCGQLGLDQEEDLYWTPTQVTLTERVKMVATGDSHTLLLTEGGQVLGCGKNECGQLGPGEEFISVPTLVPGLPIDCPITEIVSHFDSHLSVAMLCDRRCFCWGQIYSGHFVSSPFQLPPIYSTLDSALALHCTHQSTPHSVFVEDSRPNRLADRLSDMFDNPDTSDVRFVFDNCNQFDKSIYAHRFFLQITSKHFKQMFQSSMDNRLSQNPSTQVSDSNSKLLTISIANYRREIYYEYLRFLYTGQVEINENNVIELYELAQSYSEDQLSENCLEWMSATVSVQNCSHYYQLAARYRLANFEQQLANFIHDHFSQVLGTGAYLSMNGDLYRRLGAAISVLQKKSNQERE